MSRVPVKERRQINWNDIENEHGKIEKNEAKWSLSTINHSTSIRSIHNKIFSSKVQLTFQMCSNEFLRSSTKNSSKEKC